MTKSEAIEALFGADSSAANTEHVQHLLDNGLDLSVEERAELSDDAIEAFDTFKSAPRDEIEVAEPDHGLLLSLLVNLLGSQGNDESVVEETQEKAPEAEPTKAPEAPELQSTPTLVVSPVVDGLSVTTELPAMEALPRAESDSFFAVASEPEEEVAPTDDGDIVIPGGNEPPEEEELPPGKKAPVRTAGVEKPDDRKDRGAGKGRGKDEAPVIVVPPPPARRALPQRPNAEILAVMQDSHYVSNRKMLEELLPDLAVALVQEAIERHKSNFRRRSRYGGGLGVVYSRLLMLIDAVEKGQIKIFEGTGPTFTNDYLYWYVDGVPR